MPTRRSSAGFHGTPVAPVVAADRGVEAARAVARQMVGADPRPSLSIALMRGDELPWAEAFGKVDFTAAATAHRYRPGSLSKAITATLAAVLTGKVQPRRDRHVVHGIRLSEREALDRARDQRHALPGDVNGPGAKLADAFA